MGKPSREEIINYLKNHERYFTLHPWNKSHSYARNVKIYRWVPKDLLSQAYEMLEAREPFLDIETEFRSFAERYDWKYQMWFNGRSNGYIVLGQGGRRKFNYKTQCDTCGRLTYYEEGQKCEVDGCNGNLKKLLNPYYQVYIQPGLGLDMDMDFENWDYQSLLKRYALVRDFELNVVKTFSSTTAKTSM